MRLTWCALLLLATAIAGSCRGRESASAVQPPKDSALAGNVNPCGLGGCGFVVTYALGGDSAFAEWRSAVMQTNLLTDIADYLNANIVLPRRIPIVFSQCGGVANAAYARETHDITLCYELLNGFAEDFGPLAHSDAELAQAIRSSTFFTIYHETGHALIHELNLPVVGKEEDDADQLATILLLQEGQEGEEKAFESALWFLMRSAHDTSTAQLAFWDEHSFDRQRFYNIACWIYGSNHNAHLDMIEQGLLPSLRAARCEAEFQQMLQGWGTLLAPHLREGAP